MIINTRKIQCPYYKIYIAYKLIYITYKLICYINFIQNNILYKYVAIK